MGLFWMLCDSVTNYDLAFYRHRWVKSTDDREEIVTNGLGLSVFDKLLKLREYLNEGRPNIFRQLQR